MVRRFLFLFCLVLAGTLMSPVSQSVSAAGVPLKGELLGIAPVNGTTGSCTCVWQWYTIGLKRGLVTVTATMHGFANGIGPTYGIRVIVYRGKSLVATGQTACYTSGGKCSRTVHFTARIVKSQAYYVVVGGPGADGLKFTLRVAGPVYGLRCSRVC